jgi:hypothetical protein
MNTLGMRLVIARESNDDFDIRIPRWIADQLGELIVLNYNGNTLTLEPASEEMG